MQTSEQDLSRCGGAHAAGGEGAHTEQAAQCLDDVSDDAWLLSPGAGLIVTCPS